jgi:hypothetical protein
MTSAAPAVAQTAAAPRDVPLDLLRTCVVLLVVLHHAALAYHAYAPPQERLGAPSMAWTAFPIVDDRRCPGVEVLVFFNSEGVAQMALVGTAGMRAVKGGVQVRLDDSLPRRGGRQGWRG